jgi:NADPH:quinone reductase-like Zn-dependent oxidoreductase
MPTTDPGAGTMRAAVRTAYGSPDQVQVRDLPVPAVTDGRVLVRVRAAGLDRGVWHLMWGLPYVARPAFGTRRPRQPVLGSELAGVVEAVGVGVSDVEPGDEVYGITRGSFAELALVTPAKLTRRPANLSFEEAATVPVSGITALEALRERGRVEAGQHVLVIGASGGVGTYAVQLAKAFGAEVTGVCRTSKVDLVRAIGADHVVDYEQERITDAGRRYDLVIDIGGNRSIRELRQVLTPKGILVIVGGEGGSRLFGGLGRPLRATLLSPFVGQRMGTFVASEGRAGLDALRGLVEEGAVKPVIDRVCSLDDVPGALRDMEAGFLRGKVAIHIA